MRSIVVCGVGALLLASGCVGSEPESSTPRITSAQNETVSSADALLTASDLRALALGPVEVGDLSDVPVHENPDPRGPCGAVSPPAPLQDVIGRAFSGEAAVVVNMVQPATDETATYHDALKSDLRNEDCAGFRSTTNQGLTQRVDQITPVTTGPSVIAYTSRLTVGGQQFWVGAISATGDRWYSFVQIQSAEPLDDAAVAEIAASVKTRIDGA